MFSMQPQQIVELCQFAAWADREARSDLAGNYIATENDYTSNFTGALRRIINSNSSTGLMATSFILKPTFERSMGCDATIIVTSNGFAKVAPFEGKMPRFQSCNYQWDHAQTATGLSHFSNQLQRQAKYWHRFAIFEMFYCEYPFHKQPNYLKDDGSSCTWHDSTLAFDLLRSTAKHIWTRAELDAFLKKGNISVSDVLASVCQCSHGEPIKMWDGVEALAQEFGIGGDVLHIASSDNEYNE